MPSPPSTRPSDARGRQSFAFVRERHAPIDARRTPNRKTRLQCRHRSPEGAREPVEPAVEVDEAVGAVREIADFAHDEDLARAIIDRVLERGRLLRLDGLSVRTLHVNLDTMKEYSDQQAELVRISGNRWSEFPEPTPGN